METVIIDRVEGDVNENEFKISANLEMPSGVRMPTFDEIHLLGNRRRRRRLLELFRTTVNEFESFRNISFLTEKSRDQLMVNSIILRYFFSLNQAPPRFFVAMVLMIARYLMLPVRNRLEQFDSISKHTSKYPFDADLVHNFTQYQSLMLTYRQLNTIMERPLPELLPHLYMNGIFAYNMQMALFEVVNGRTLTLSQKIELYLSGFTQANTTVVFMLTFIAKNESLLDSIC